MFGNDPSEYALRYELAACLNGLGTVHLAQHRPSGELVAIKRFRLDKARVDNHVVSDEILAMRQFHHPHVLTCLAAFTCPGDGGDVRVVLPLQCYRSCRAMLDNYFLTGFPELLVALLMRDALHGLDYLHRRGVVHRSLRASHILVGRGRAVLGGFRECCSMLANGQRVQQLHEMPGAGGAVRGAAATTSPKHLNWCAPEVLEQNVLGYTEKADVYSAGITTCELANSLEPFADMPQTFMLTEKMRGNTPALLDCSTCPPPMASDSGVGDSLAETHQIYGSRALSDHFHKFAEICMSRFAIERPTVAQLLTHAFFKQTKATTLHDQLALAGAEVLDCTRPGTQSVAKPAAAAAGGLQGLDSEFGGMQLQGFEWDF